MLYTFFFFCSYRYDVKGLENKIGWQIKVRTENSSPKPSENPWCEEIFFWNQSSSIWRRRGRQGYTCGRGWRWIGWWRRRVWPFYLHGCRHLWPSALRDSFGGCCQFIQAAICVSLHSSFSLTFSLEYYCGHPYFPLTTSQRALKHEDGIMGLLCVSFWFFRRAYCWPRRCFCLCSKLLRKRNWGWACVCLCVHLVLSTR